MNIEDLHRLVTRVADLRVEEQRIGDQKKIATSNLETAENELLLALQNNNLTSFRSGAGLVSISSRLSVKTPKTPEEKEAFYSFLKEKGYYEELISVNSQKLNGFYKEQFELARERGEDDFEIPGIKDVTMTPNLSFRRA